MPSASGSGLPSDAVVHAVAVVTVVGAVAVDVVDVVDLPWSIDEHPNHQNPAGRGNGGSALSTYIEEKW